MLGWPLPAAEHTRIEVPALVRLWVVASRSLCVRVCVCAAR